MIHQYMCTSTCIYIETASVMYCYVYLVKMIMFVYLVKMIDSNSVLFASSNKAVSQCVHE